ncbi:hypothetical protein SRB5_43830 [Streptomyces sp. RB5]|uniref:Uncharacterized protein n=1 Tax=Streptomyces smaragdinus TaxID=2585196 RepID=A0A7K0CLC6_9ACTN|nr:DUF6882 domain-containing protein [Streptomyces smaragdinus]MQY14221.1 hypothetical protein [Streptomyces smaragdinus]
MTTEFTPAFLDETESHTAWGAAQLEALTDFLPDDDWTADLPACVYRQGALELRVGVLGSYDSGDRSWMWGWANPGLAGTPVAALSEQVARVGKERGIAEFGEGMLDLSGHADPGRAAETLAFAGMGVTRSPGYIGVPAGGTTRVYFLPDDPQVPRAGFDAVTMPRMLITGAGLLGRSPHRVVTGYFDHHGLAHRTDGRRLVADLPNGRRAEVDFDEAGRIAGVRATVTG